MSETVKGAGPSRSGIQADVPVDTAEYAVAAGRRFRRTVARIPALEGPVLDMGPPNAFARVLEQRFSVSMDNTGHHDLDRERLSDFVPGPYATITSFEILEHLLNPLFVLDGCREVIRPDGVLYITVPKRHSWEWLFGKSEEHFHEFAKDELFWVVEKAGFQVRRFETFNTSGVGLGVRPILRGMIKDLMFLECRPV